MKFTIVCEHCRREIRHQATVAQEKQLIKTLSMSFPCLSCQQQLHVQMCDDGSIVSISGVSSPTANSGEPDDSVVGFSSVQTAAPEQHPEPQMPQEVPPVLPNTPDAYAATPPPSTLPPVAGHVPFASLDDAPKKRKANTGWPFLDNLIDDPPTPIQIVLGVALIFAAVFVFKFNPKSISSPAPVNKESTSTQVSSESATTETIDSEADADQSEPTSTQKSVDNERQSGEPDSEETSDKQSVDTSNDSQDSPSSAPK